MIGVSKVELFIQEFSFQLRYHLRFLKQVELHCYPDSMRNPGSLRSQGLHQVELEDFLDLKKLQDFEGLHQLPFDRLPQLGLDLKQHRDFHRLANPH
ncbi:hypothetical protein TYRP_008357 [Tyrophagus putrescentiae]|nr:hypothetical protein TYRP_008357 [Tyrophagus putrescentiae]